MYMVPEYKVGGGMGIGGRQHTAVSDFGGCLDSR
jgi:hypothetical protein